MGTGLGQALVEDDAASGLTYSSGWARTTSANASGGGYHETSQLGASVDFAFTGNALSVLYGTTCCGGILRVTLDPGANQVVLGDIDQCDHGNGFVAAPPRTFSGFAGGSHTRLRRAELPG